MRESNYRQVISHVYKNEGEEVADWNVLCRSWRELSKKPFVANKTGVDTAESEPPKNFSEVGVQMAVAVVIRASKRARRPQRRTSAVPSEKTLGLKEVQQRSKASSYKRMYSVV